MVVTLLASAGFCHQQDDKQQVQHTLQRNTVSVISCPLATDQHITWSTLEGGQVGIPWERHMVFTNVQGPESQLYLCQDGSSTAFVNVTVTDIPSNATEGSVTYCQHGKPCALVCPSTKDDTMMWPGMTFVEDVWWGEEWPNGVIMV